MDQLNLPGPDFVSPVPEFDNAGRRPGRPGVAAEAGETPALAFSSEARRPINGQAGEGLHDDEDPDLDIVDAARADQGGLMNEGDNIPGGSEPARPAAGRPNPEPDPTRPTDPDDDGALPPADQRDAIEKVPGRP